MNAGLLRRLAGNARAAAARGRDVVDSAPFELFLSRDSSDYLLSFAWPKAVVRDWAPALDDLRARFAAHGRLMRLEFFADLYPDLGAAAEAAGLHRNMAAAVMVATAPCAVGAGLGETTHLIGAADADDLIPRMLAMQAEAFGFKLSSDGETAWRRRFTEGVQEGSLLAAVTLQEGEPAAAAMLLLGGGTAELAGVATRPALRRRGLALQTCAALLRAYFAAGYDLAWLSAGPEVEGLYRRLGFRSAGTQLNYGVRAL